MVVKVSELGDASLPLTGSELVHLVQGGVSKKGTTADIAALADAGGSSDVRDGIRTWLAPYNVSKDASAATNIAGINQAILDARSHARGAPVLLPQGILNINAPIVVYPGTRLKGQAPADNANGTATSSGTKLFLASGSNCNVIQDSGWAGSTGSWAQGEISDLFIDANQANNAAGLSGIAIYAMGEASVIQRCHVQNAKRYGFEIKAGSSPATLRLCSANSNVLGGLYHEGNGALLIDSLAGELNDAAFVHLKGGLNASVILLNCRHSDPADGQVAVLDLEDFQGSVQVLGGRFLTNSEEEGGTNVNDAFVKIRGSSTPAVLRIKGVVENEHTNTVDDQVNGRQYPRRSTGAVDNVGDFELGQEHNVVSGVLTVLPLAGGTALGNGPKILSGSGVPSIAVPNGSLWLRTDTGHLYARINSAWALLQT